MAKLTITVDDDLMRQIKARPHINWSKAAREGIRRRLNELDYWDDQLKDSQMTEEDVKEMADEVDEAMARRFEALRKD